MSMSTGTKVVLGVGAVWLGGAVFFKWRADADAKQHNLQPIDWSHALVWPTWAFKGSLTTGG
jgi:hypothetical protein